jgi:hypothetical protein
MTLYDRRAYDLKFRKWSPSSASVISVVIARTSATREVRIPGPIPTVRLLYEFISVARERMSSNGTIASVISGYRDVSICRLTPQERRDIFVQPVDVWARLYLSLLSKNTVW